MKIPKMMREIMDRVLYRREPVPILTRLEDCEKVPDLTIEPGTRLEMVWRYNTALGYKELVKASKLIPRLKPRHLTSG